MSTWPPEPRQNPVSYISADNEGEQIVQKVTTLDFKGKMSSVSDVGSGVAQVITRLQIVTEDPSDAVAGDAWILRVDDNYSISHSLMQIGLTMMTQAFIYYLRVKSDAGDILSIRLSN